jgi:hypothetical protein
MIENKDRMVGAMVKALAVEVAGFQAVKGTTKGFLATHGYYDFEFASEAAAAAFREAVGKYVPKLASVHK